MFTLAHISDPHLGPLPAANPLELLNKRLFGFLSWHHRRKKLHKTEVLEILARDLVALAPDQVAITGDLTNIALPGEFERVTRWLREIGRPDRVMVVPGNHDAYVDLAWDRSIGLWRDYMSSIDRQGVVSTATGAQDFPFVRRFGDIALVGLSTAHPTPLGFASGSLGVRQLRECEALLKELGAENLYRVVLLHHPPLRARTSWRKRLVDGPAFRTVIARAGAELILHGHDHRFGRDALPAGRGTAAVFGVPSASAERAGRKPQAHYIVFRIERSGAGSWQAQASMNAYDPETKSFVLNDEFDL